MTVDLDALDKRAQQIANDHRLCERHCEAKNKAQYVCATIEQLRYAVEQLRGENFILDGIKP